jgi:signal transduction histidine kinase/ActR/RegA family two-component response regulator
MGPADAYPFRTLPAPLRFAIALAAVAIVFAIDRGLGTLVDDGSQFLMLGMAVMASAWFAGTGPALAATVLGGVIGALEAGDPILSGPASQAHLALFVIQGLLLTGLIGELRRARRTAEYEAHEAQEARRAGEAANHMKDEFLATVSHELRTPLNAVLGWVHLLRTGKLDTSTATRGLDSIDRNVRLQAQLTADLLDMSKALTGKLRIEPRVVSLADAARLASASAVPAAQAKGVQIRTMVPEASVPVLGDATRLRQIAWHLLANAIKFTPRGGIVTVSVETGGDQARLVVADSGPGIDPEFLPRIFDRFTQEDASPTRTAGGLGVGLSLVRELVQLHGGEIEARNREHGAVFTASFPLQTSAALEDVYAPEPTAISSAPSAPLDGIRVLVLDQDREGRELLKTILQQRGASVRVVDSVAEALEALEGWRPDILVSDSASPDHDSYALVGKVHSLEADKGGRIPALALTSFARTDQRLRQMLAGVQRELPKPIEPAVLTAEIARLTGRERRRAHR